MTTLTIPAGTHLNCFDAEHQRKTIPASLLVIPKDQGIRNLDGVQDRPIITLDFYHPQKRAGNTLWCCVWINDPRSSVNISSSATRSYSTPLAVFRHALDRVGLHSNNSNNSNNECRIIRICQDIMTALHYERHEYVIAYR